MPLPVTLFTDPANWKYGVESQARTRAEEHPMTPFFEADLRGEIFQCLIGTSGPMVIGDGGGACLGVCAIRNLAHFEWKGHGQIEVADEVGQPSWCIVKYEHERCIELPWPTTLDEARELGETLGIVMWRPMLHPSVRAEAFYVSPAFRALRTWVAEHANLAAKFAEHEASRHYLPDWYERALVGAVPPSEVGDQILSQRRPS
jgi:hypothetical protein